MSSFAETTMIPATRMQLVRYARWENLCLLDDWSDRTLAMRLHRLAPGLKGLSDQDILDRFTELRYLVATADTLGDPLTRLQLGASEAEADAADFALSIALFELVPGEVP